MPNEHIMSGRFPELNRQTFEHEIPLDSHRHAQGHESCNSEDPRLAEEAQLLLSQFMKKSSQDSHGRSHRRSDDVVRGDSTFHPRGKAKDDRPVSRWEANCTFSGDSSSASSRDKKVHLPARASTGRQQRGGERTYSLSTNRQRPSDNNSSGKPPGKTLGYSRRESQAHSASASVAQGTGESKDHTDSASTFLPIAAERRSSPPTRTARLKSPGKEEPSAAKVTRRPRRVTSGAVNYRTKIKIDDSESDVETDNDLTPRNPVSSSSSPRDQSSESRVLGQSFIVYSSSDVQIVECLFNSHDDRLTHAYYAPEPSPVGYAKKFRRKPTQRVLHADFDEEEMSAVLKLLSFYGFRWNSSSDIPLTDQVISVVASMSTTRDALTLSADGVSWICELSWLLLNYRADDVESFLLAIMKSDANSGNKLGRMQSVIRNIFGLRIRTGQGRSLSRCSKSERFNQLLNCLTYASILRRRYRADIEAFLTDAMNCRLATVPRFVQGISMKNDHSSGRRSTKKFTSINKLLRSRELGYPVNQRIQTSASRNVRPCSTWKGASGDVIVSSWSPDGTRFAVGAAAQSDDYNMEYNRGNNLLLGDLTRNSLRELPDHWIPRSSQRAISDQAGTSPRLFMSVTAMQWHENTLFTASYDNTVKLWDVSSHDDAFCFKTLRHQSKVEVMARSNFNKNILATGADSIGFWNLAEREPRYTPLELIRSKKDIELVPTSLAWGTNPATEDHLIAGMSERDPEDASVPLNGHLGMWRANESSMIPVQLSPNSQNIFDIKWHPSLPAFATASSVPHTKTPGTSKEAKSVVRIYEPLSSRRCTVEFDCPALDINDVTFCPRNPNYVTASCTDGVSYVWDYRNPSDVLLKLKHGAPLNQIDENLSREQADVGVRLALWGDTIDQFYTGSSDGALKLWNILLSQEDALIEDKANFMEEIMSGAFSEDKSNLLIGDSAGGVHILSSGPFLTESDSQMNYERAVEPDVDNGQSADSESGVETSKRLLSSGQLDRHPIYGVGQGPCYRGPFAAWARPNDTPKDELPLVPLEMEHRIRQFDGIPVKDRPGLDNQSRKDLAAHMRLAQIRNQRRHEHKRKRDTTSGNNNKMAHDSGSYIGIRNDDETRSRSPLSTKFKRRTHGRPVINRVEPEIIDLTGDSDLDDTVEPFANEAETGYYQTRPSGLGVVETETLTDDPHENWEEDFWWPASADIDANIQDVDV